MVTEFTLRKDLEYHQDAARLIINKLNDLQTIEEKAIMAQSELLKDIPHEQLIFDWWECEDDNKDGYKNPIKTCIYNEYEDPMRDSCLFCGQPQERK